MTGPTPTRKRVLVADDEPHIGRIVKMKLEQGPFDVILVENGDAAVETMEADPGISLAILDLMMPGRTGLEVLEWMRSSAPTRFVPAVILTAAGEEDQERKSMTVGANAFLTKPFSPKKLYAMVEMLTGVDPSARVDDE